MTTKQKKMKNKYKDEELLSGPLSFLSHLKEAK